MVRNVLQGFFFVLAAAAAAFGQGAAAPKASDAEAASAIERRVDELARQGAFSGAVLVARGSKTLVAKPAGDADRATGARNTMETKFDVGSINKLFTLVAVAQLAEAGKLSLADTVKKWLPELPVPHSDVITIQELASMTSGLGDIFGPRWDRYPKEKLRSLSDYVPLFANQPLQFAPGTRQQYSNAGFVVLGLIVERASGEDYYAYVRNHVFGPAGMHDTDSWAEDDPVAHRAIGYMRASPGGALVANTSTLPARGSSAGGGYSTAGDLLKFAAALRQFRLLPPEWTAWLFTRGMHPPSPAAAPRTIRGGFGGGAPGLNAVLLMDGPTTIVVLANMDPPAAENLAREIRSWLPR